jgi:hypothetical protein
MHISSAYLGIGSGAFANGSLPGTTDPWYAIVSLTFDAFQKLLLVSLQQAQVACPSKVSYLWFFVLISHKKQLFSK